MFIVRRIVYFSRFLNTQYRLYNYHLFYNTISIKQLLNVIINKQHYDLYILYFDAFYEFASVIYTIYISLEVPINNIGKYFIRMKRHRIKSATSCCQRVPNLFNNTRRIDGKKHTYTHTHT